MSTDASCLDPFIDVVPAKTGLGCLALSHAYLDALSDIELRIRLIVMTRGAIAPSAQRHDRQSGSNREQDPQESPKHRRSLSCTTHTPEANTITQEHGRSNEAREPENHRDCLDGRKYDWVMCACLGEAPWDENEEDECEDGPDGTEDEEVHAVGRVGVPVAGPPVDDVC